MNLTEYQDFCKKGVLAPTKQLPEALIFGLGLTGEAGEVADIIKKHYGHGKDLNKYHLREELGDVLWYIANLCTTFHFTLEEVMKVNVEKLQNRYPEEYFANEIIASSNNAVIATKKHCKKGCPDDYLCEISGPHIKVSCATCGTFITFVAKKDMNLYHVTEDVPWKTE